MANREIAMTALLTCPTIQAASKSSGIPVRTLYDMRASPDFAREYAQRRRQITEDACTALQGKMSEAVEVIATLMTGEGIPARVRLDAAKTVLELGLKCLETQDILLRLDALESAADCRNSPKGGLL